MKCTIQSIADELELSRNTVARVLSGKEGVSAKTRKLVLRKAEEMGYRAAVPPLPKRQLPTLPDSIVFLTDSSMGTPEARSAVIQTVEAYIKKQNYNLILAVIEPDHSSKKEPQLPAVLYSPSVRGICMMDIEEGSIYRAVLRLKLPTAAIISSEHLHSPAAATITSEHSEGLASLRDSIDWISADVRQYQQRLATALTTHAKSSVRYITRQEPLSDLFAQDTLADYFLCEDDWTAIHLIHAAQAAGYAVPDDFSVIGCGNIPESAHVFPALSTIQIPWSQIGTAAARCITDRICDPELSCMSIRFTAKSIERHSAILSPGGVSAHELIL